MRAKKQLESLYGLKGICIIIVFVAHFLSFYGKNGLFVYGAISIFIMLSGFTYVYSRGEKENEKLDSKEAFLYVTKKVKRFYYIYFIMFLGGIEANYFIRHSYIGGITLKNVLSGILNLLMLQSFVPDRTIYFDFNGVSWYLSTTIFFWFMAPTILFILNKLNFTKKVVLAVGIYSIQILITYIFYNTEYSNAILYVNPFFRCGDYIIGCIAGKLFLEKESQSIETNTNKKEIISIILFAIAMYLAVIVPSGVASSVLFTPVSIFLIYEMAKQKGIFSEILTRKPISSIGRNTMYIFLTHYLVIESSFAIFDKNTVNKGIVFIYCIIVTSYISYAFYRWDRRKERR